MNHRHIRVALGGVLLALAAGFVPACSSQEGLEARRLRAQRSTRAELLADQERREAEAGLDELQPGGDAAPAETAAQPEEAPTEAVPSADVSPAVAREEDIPALDSLLEEPATAKEATTPPAEPPAPSTEATRPPLGPSAPLPEVDESDPSSIILAMKVAEEARKAEGRFWSAKGDEAYFANDYPKAVELYRKALDKDPYLEEARKRMHEAQMILNERAGEVGSIFQEYRDQEKVQEQLTLAEFQRNRDKAKAAFEAGDVDEALRLASLAVEQGKRNPKLVGEAGIQAVRDELEEYRREKYRREERKREDQLKAVRGQIYQEQEEEEAYKHRLVQNHLRRASTAIFRKNYHKAVESCESALELDPDNMVAKFWIRMSKDQILKRRRLKLIQDRLENTKLLEERIQEILTAQQEMFVFPDEDYWEQVQRRQGGLEPDDEMREPEPIRRMKAALTSTPVNVNFDETSLKDVIETFRTITNINIHIDPEVDAESFTVTQRISNLPALNALNLVLEQHGLGFKFEENMMVITSADQASADPTFETYLVTDLLMKIRDFHAPEMRLRDPSEGEGGGAPIDFTDDFAEEEEPLDADALIELIQEATGGDDAWTDESSIEYNQGQLFVNAPRELHVKIAEVLDNLRQDSDLFVVIEARFIDVNDDFLEDIGIDSRALGIDNNLGVPFGGIINDASTGGNDIGFVQQGDLTDINLVMGTDRWAGRVQHIIDGFGGTIRGDRVNAGGGSSGLTLQATWLEPFQVNVILRAVQEKSDVRQLTAPMVTAHNNERVYVSVITQRAYIADYELVSGGTGFAIIEVADPVVQTFQEGVILDVDPTISPDKKYVTLDVRPTLATLIGGVISTINISLGSFTNVAFQVPIGVPQIALQQSFTSVTVPNGGTVLLGGFNSVNDGRFESYLPIFGHLPIVKNLVRRKATIIEKRSLVILLTARIVDLRGEEKQRFTQE